MASNDSYFSVSGYVATQPKDGQTRDGTRTLSFRVGWTPRALNRATGEWADLPSSFASVTCYRKLAEHARFCLRKGDPIVLKGNLRVREYDDQAGLRRNSVDINADFVGHDMARGTSQFSRQRPHTGLTAAEYSQSQEAGHGRLPGDVPDDQPEAADADEADAMSEVGDAPEPEDAEFADRYQEAEPVGAGV